MRPRGKKLEVLIREAAEKTVEANEVIDGRTIGDGRPGPVTKLLRKKFFEYAHKK